jgi:3-methyladenine DNA glycosylase AlkD
LRKNAAAGLLAAFHPEQIMERSFNRKSIVELARAIDEDIAALPVQNVPHIRAVRRRYSRRLKKAEPEFILRVAQELFESYGHRWVAYELIAYHPRALQCVGETELRTFGRGLDHWGAVDAFACFLAGPAWRERQVPDGLIHNWARSKDRWWRRAALVSTVALNRKSLSGSGDVPRTLGVCRLLVHDRDDMMVKAMSWALRELIAHDREAVRRFLREHEAVLSARVKREVRNKLTTGLKNPKNRVNRLE